jgi:hypothetical protein
MVKNLIASLQKKKQKISDHLSLSTKTGKGYVALCCIIKDENEYLQEWINYHLKIGIEHFFIYDNGSKIPIWLTIEKHNLSKYVTVIKMPGKARQIKAYAHCLKSFGKAYKWIGFIDTDEFIVPKLTNGDFKAFLSQYEPYGGLGINWMMFGSSGHLKRTNSPQLESFLFRAEESFRANAHIKSIVQPAFVKSVLGSHNFEYQEGKYCVNENFEPIEGPFSKNSVNKIQLNHYYCRSREEYESKIKRGYGDTRKKRTIDEFYEHDRDSNKVKDTTILEILNNFSEVVN